MEHIYMFFRFVGRNRRRVGISLVAIGGVALLFPDLFDQLKWIIITTLVILWVTAGNSS